MFKKIVLVLVVVVLLFGIYVATRPTRWRVERSAVLPAASSVLYPKVADFQAWDAWSPWAKLDPGMKVDFSGTPGTVGSTYHWVGNDKVGEGRMTILELIPDRLVRIKLHFVKPWEQVSTTEFSFVPEGAGTKVTWAMSGENDLVGKAFAVFLDMDKVIGPDFEKGLAKLKAETSR
ncbi:MAG: SRPBCC family protein [Deltaproteobacteria bacterium]